ncbi:MAG: GNAT family N-acetyltransferase [Stackebrandtia sp.]
MNASPRCEFETDVAAFAAATRAWRDADPVANNVVSTIVESRANAVAATEPDALWVKILRGDEVVGLAVQTPPRGLLLPRLSEEAVDALSLALLEARGNLVGVNGPKETADRFVSLWSIRAGCRADVDMESRMHRLDGDPAHPSGVPGRARRADVDDLEVISTWATKFMDETLPNERADIADQIAVVRKRIARSQYWMWEVDGRPTSMLAESAPSAGVVRIQLVYTPVELRGHGYASACVAHASQDIASRPETKAVVLYTDLANPTSNKIYRRIGYRKLLDAVNYRFTYPN